MSKQETVEIFRNHGVNVTIDDNAGKVMDALNQNTPDELWPLLEDFTGGKPIGVDFANETMHTYTLSYALVEAFEQGKESITQDDVTNAFNRAAKLADSLARNGSTRPDRVEETVEDDEGNVKPKTTRKRDAGLKPLIYDLVEQNPKAQGNEIVEMVQKNKPNAKDGTIKVYYSQARNELGLPNIGKRGRRPKS